jgi:Phage related hypothetical protein (DUF1799)
LTARARWERELGRDYLKAMQDAGREVDAADLPPTLEWESAIWELYLLVCTQWRIAANGRATGLDYNPAIALMRHWGWEIDLGLELLQAVEAEKMQPG